MLPEDRAQWKPPEVRRLCGVAGNLAAAAIDLASLAGLEIVLCARHGEWFIPGGDAHYWCVAEDFADVE